MNNQVDARGMSCPKPVIETKKVLDQLLGESMITIVDNEVAMQNVSKLAQSLSYDVEVKKVENDFHINIYRGETTPAVNYTTQDKKDLVIMFTKDTLGQGSDELGKVLMKGYIYTVTESNPYPKAMLFMNGAVKLTTEGSEVIEYLRELEKQGVEILSCGTCLDYFKMKDQLIVGGVSNMYSIVDTLHTTKNRVVL
ncbi:sulfurtransferase-like selenium metabolism protein YedF [Lutibacter sp. B2]|nr:sulfurtransferase-like selenium metabolism protein YedF [Lutibacter sp. B2]